MAAGDYQWLGMFDGLRDDNQALRDENKRLTDKNKTLNRMFEWMRAVAVDYGYDEYDGTRQWHIPHQYLPRAKTLTASIELALKKVPDERSVENG